MAKAGYRCRQKHDRAMGNVAEKFNASTADDKPTLIVYLDSTHTASKISTKADKLCELLRKAGGPNQKRLCIIRREHGQVQFVPLPALTRFDEPNKDMTEIMAVHPINDPESDRG